jgi:NADH:ubiquinone oxidoreductase subunit F (NADH-binding)/Pyruvate/2-oxoacid:ferredoxin oxidoreductase delta subunit
LLNGPEWFASMGTAKSKGTKTFALAGDVKHTGLIEVPLGISLREIVYDVGGGIKDDKGFKAIQIGGPMGGFLCAQHLDLPVDYESLQAVGAMMGSGGAVVMDEETCMVDMARFFMEFTQDESCGKCTPCRVGTRRLLEILQKICAGLGEPGDIETLEMLSSQISATSLCGLGAGAPNPVVSTLKLFRDEYEAHIFEKRCPAKVCKALIRYDVVKEFCTGCTVCARNCPAGAITGERRQVHYIDPDICIRCGICLQVCNFNAIAIN